MRCCPSPVSSAILSAMTRIRSRVSSSRCLTSVTRTRTAVIGAL